MEYVIIFITIVVLWVLRKTIRIWSTVSENVSTSTARKVMINTVEQDISTSKRTKELLDDKEFDMDLADMDAFLFHGTRPKPAE